MRPQAGTWPQWITAGLALGTIVLSVVTLWVRSGLASAQDVRDAAVERTQLDRRVLVLEKSAEATDRLAGAVTTLSTQVAVLVSRVEGLERAVRVQARRGAE